MALRRSNSRACLIKHLINRNGVSPDRDAKPRIIAEKNLCDAEQGWGGISKGSPLPLLVRVPQAVFVLFCCGSHYSLRSAVVTTACVMA